MSGAGGGFGGQHSDMYEAWLAHVPGLKVVVPSNPADQKGLLTSCIFDDDPRIFIESRLLMGSKGAAPSVCHSVPLGKANIVREGGDVTLIGSDLPLIGAAIDSEAFAKEGVAGGQISEVRIELCRERGG